MIVRNADGTPSDPREVDLFESTVLRRRVAEVLDPYAEGITPHAVLFNELKEVQEGRADDDEEETEAATEATASEEDERLAAWNEAVLRGDDPVAATTGTEWSAIEPNFEPEAFGGDAERWDEDEVNEEAPLPVAEAAPSEPPVVESAPAGEMSDEEAARRKAAWKKAMAAAFASGGEEAVAKVAQMDWREFGDSD